MVWGKREAASMGQLRLSKVCRLKMMSRGRPTEGGKSARRAPVTSSFPHRLRRRGQEILGIRNLPPRDIEKLKTAVRLFRVSLEQGGTGFLDNPDTSLIWYYLGTVLAR